MERPFKELLSEQYLCPDLSDVKISVPYEDGNKVAVFPAHSLILKLHSVVFRAMLESSNYTEGRTGEITVGGYLPETVEHFLRAIYTGKLPDNLSWFQSLELLKISHMYEVSSIINKCSRQIKSVEPMPLAEACILHDVAKLRNLEVLEFTCRDKIQNSFESCLNDDLHFNLDEESFGYFLNVFKKKIMNNDDLRKAVTRWCIWRCCINGSEITEFNVSSFLPPSNDDLKPEMKYDGSQFKSTLVQNWITRLYLNQKATDMEILIQGEESMKFPVHSFVLDNQSNVFQSLCTTANRSGEKNVPQIILSHITPRVLDILLRYLYTRFFPREISEIDLFGTSKAAHTYEVKDLEKICAEKLILRISVSNCFDMLVLAKRINLKILKECSIEKIMYSKYSGYIYLDEAIMTELMNSSKTKSLKSKNKISIWKQWSILRCCLNGQEPNKDNVRKYMGSIPTTSKPEQCKDANCLTFFSGKSVLDADNENAQAQTLGLYSNDFTYKILSLCAKKSTVLVEFKMYVFLGKLAPHVATQQMGNYCNSCYFARTQNNSQIFHRSLAFVGDPLVCQNCNKKISRTCDTPVSNMILLGASGEGEPKILDAEMVVKEKTKYVSENTNHKLHSVLVKPRLQLVLKQNEVQTFYIAAKKDDLIFLPEFHFSARGAASSTVSFKSVKILHLNSCVRKISLKKI